MNLPPLPALEMLDTLARTGSIRHTADLMALSQSAVSHRLRALEDRLGFRLTLPEGRGITLTAEARRYVAAIRPALAMLREAHHDLTAARGALEVAVPSGLAATWLAPRLGGFMAAYPDISLTLRSHPAGEPPPPSDLQIAFTDAPPDGAEPLHRVSFFPVCSPDFARRHDPTPAALRPEQLLHLHRRSDWENWLATANAPQRLDHGTMFSGLLAMYAAAEAGLGLCLADRLTSAAALQDGRLLRPFKPEMQARASYWLLPSPSGLTTPASLFAAWLRDAFAAL